MCPCAGEAGASGTDLVSHLLRAKAERGSEAVPDRLIRDELMGVLFGGADTTAAIIAWTLYHLSVDPVCLSAAAGELRGVLGVR
jgi:cytochrome P450